METLVYIILYLTIAYLIIATLAHLYVLREVNKKEKLVKKILKQLPKEISKD